MSYTFYNGFSVPEIGFGTFPQKEELFDSLVYATSCNTSPILIDTSDDYYNHKYIGQSLLQGNIKRADVFVCTKFSFPHMLSDFEKAFEETCVQLRVDCVDVYLLHWPYPVIFLDAWREMEKLYKEGRVKAIGVCNCEVKHLEYLKNHCEILPMINELEVHPLFQQKETCEYCKNNDIAVFAYSPFARMDKTVLENKVLLSLSEKHQKTVQQIILRWCFQNKYVALPSSRSEQHIKENYSIFDFQLSDDDMKIISSLDCGHRVRFNPNTYFTLRDKCGMVKKHLIYKMKNK